MNQELQAKFEGLPLAQVSTITKQEKGERSQLRRNASLKKRTVSICRSDISVIVSGLHQT